MKRRQLIRNVAAGGLLALGATSAASARDECTFSCCEECAKRDWSCGSGSCHCVQWCQYVK